MSKPLIIGVDIGTTTGLAIYDLDKNLLYTGSKRNFSFSSIVKEIMNFGSPLIVATDKKNVSKKIRKLASTFNSKIYSPENDLTIEQKEDILRINIKDDHERDALAAASFAFREHEAMFNSIERALNAMHLGQYKDKVKEMIITGRAKNIADAIDRIRPKKEQIIKTEMKEVNVDWKEKAEKYKKVLRDYDRRQEIRKLYTEKLEDKVKILERQKKIYLEEETKKNENTRKELLKEKEMRKMGIVIKQLQFELSKQKKLKKVYENTIRKQQEVIEIQSEGLVAAIKIPDFTKDAVEEYVEKFDIENKVVWIENYSPSRIAARILAKKKPKVVIADMDDVTKKFLRKNGIIVIDSINPKMREYYCAVSPKEMQSSMLKTEKRSFLKWLEEYRKR